MANLEPDFVALYDKVKPYTMTSWERLYALYKATRYVVENRIPGDVVECGVWRGGSMQLTARVLLALGETDRKLYLYDTYEGMTQPEGDIDVDFAGRSADIDWEQIKEMGVKWAYAPLEEVRENMATTGYPMEQIVFVKGPVETTLPGTIPERIALLRLDTDWYSSTKHEMEHLYPRLSAEGVLILDDYGHYRGAARAADEYLARVEKKPLLQRIDYACRIAIKRAN
jgi:O-methyltransferase